VKNPNNMGLPNGEFSRRCHKVENFELSGADFGEIDPSPSPSIDPSQFPSSSPSVKASSNPSPSPSIDPSEVPSGSPSVKASSNPSDRTSQKKGKRKLVEKW